ncbi:MAG: hypothetical protein WA240_11470 [Nitrospirota bacterium]
METPALKDELVEDYFQKEKERQKDLSKEITCSQQFNATPVGTLRKVFSSLKSFWDDRLTYPELSLSLSS